MKRIETNFGYIPCDWKLAKIGTMANTITDYVANGSFASLKENVRYLDEETDNVLIRLTDYNNDFTGPFVYVDDHAYEFLSKSRLFGGEIIISNVGANVGTVFRCPELNKKMTLGPNAIVLRFENKSCIDDFYYYWFLSPAGQFSLQSLVTGSAQPKFNKTSFRSMVIPIPPIEMQEKTSELLKTLDRKIAVNKQANDYLESMIEAMLSQLLAGEANKSVSLGDYLYIKGRIGWKGLKKSEYLPISDYRIINGESLTLSGINWEKAGFISKERYEESPEIMLEVGDILLSKDGTIGKIGYVDELETPTSVASGIFVIRNTRQDELSTHFIYYLLKSHMFKAFVAGRTEGSVIPHLYQKDFVEFRFPLPDANAMKAFEDATRPMFDQVIGNTRENKMLSELRDALLPKLMSGEIDVSQIELPMQPNNK